MSLSTLPCLSEDGVGQIVADVGDKLSRITITYYSDGPGTEPTMALEVASSELVAWCRLIEQQVHATIAVPDAICLLNERADHGPLSSDEARSERAVLLARRVLLPAPGPIFEEHRGRCVQLRLPVPLEGCQGAGPWWFFDSQTPAIIYGGMTEEGAIGLRSNE